MCNENRINPVYLYVEENALCTTERATQTSQCEFMDATNLNSVKPVTLEINVMSIEF